MPSGITPNTNMASLIALHQTQRNAQRMTGSMIPLATGSRINRGADDPAGLIASENLRAELSAIDAEQRALERNDAVANVADAAMSEISNLTTDLNASAVAVANTGGMSDAEREAYQMEADSAVQTIDRIASTASFNGQRIFSGEFSISSGGGPQDPSMYTIGETGSAYAGEVTDGTNTYNLRDISSGRALNFVNGDPSMAQQSINAARDEFSSMRGALGAFQKNAIGSTRRANAVEFENVSSANSIIRDTDYARATSVQARASVMYTSSIYTLNSANQQAWGALNVLG